MGQEKIITMACPQEVPCDVEGSEEVPSFRVLRATETRFAKQEVDRLMDRNDENLRVPELVICYRERSFLEVKDICIDGGVNTHENVLLQTDMDKGPSTNILGGKDKESSLLVGRMDDHFSAANFLNCSEYHYFVDAVKPNVHADLLSTEIKADDVAEAKSRVEDVSLQILPCDSSDNVCNGSSSKESNLEQITDATALALANEGNNGCLEDASATSADLSSASSPEDPQKQSHIEKLPDDCEADKVPCPPVSTGTNKDTFDASEAECGSTASNSDASASASTSGEEIHNTKARDKTTRHRVSHSQTEHQAGTFSGESSFSMAGPMSSLITYSEPVAYSGSLSLRSDGSATSIRSFAFPILQNEWNSSPVRMVNADRRIFRRHRGWRHGLLCCRF